MKCPECGCEAGGRVICPQCGAYISAEMIAFKEHYLNEKVNEEYSITLCAGGGRAKTITVSGSATIANTPNHTSIQVFRTVNGQETVSDIEGKDSFLSNKERVVITPENGRFRIIDVPHGCSVNGRSVSGSVVVSEGDMVALTPLSYFRIDICGKKPSMSAGVLSLIPDGSVIGEDFVFRRGFNRYFNGISQNCYSCPDVRMTSVLEGKDATAVNRIILASEYLRTMKVLKDDN